MTKPTNPNLTIPEYFAMNGVKTDFETEKIQNGFNALEPDILSGDNLNKFIDDTYKGLNYATKGVSDLYKSVILYDATETYNKQSIVFNIADDGKTTIFKSLADNNTGNNLSDTSKWEEISLGTDFLNNPYSLFDSKYSDHELNNLSWLKSEGQWNAKAVYTDAYDKLLKVYNGTETVEGLSVKLSTEDYTDYDFVLNTAEETFRLPLKTLHSDDTVDGFSLYYYVGETVQNANLIDAGRIGEQLANKQDKCIHIIDTYVNGTSWYRVWSDGWCEQGFCPASASASTYTTATLLKPFKDTNYSIFISFYNGNWYPRFNSKTTSSFTFDTNVKACWIACGYIN